MRVLPSKVVKFSVTFAFSSLMKCKNYPRVDAIDYFFLHFENEEKVSVFK